MMPTYLSIYLLELLRYLRFSTFLVCFLRQFSTGSHAIHAMLHIQLILPQDIQEENSTFILQWFSSLSHYGDLINANNCTEPPVTLMPLFVPLYFFFCVCVCIRLHLEIKE